MHSRRFVIKGCFAEALTLTTSTHRTHPSRNTLQYPFYLLDTVYFTPHLFLLATFLSIANLISRSPSIFVLFINPHHSATRSSSPEFPHVLPQRLLTISLSIDQTRARFSSRFELSGHVVRHRKLDSRSLQHLSTVLISFCWSHR
jgi:hypothetical protein